MSAEQGGLLKVMTPEYPVDWSELAAVNGVDPKAFVYFFPLDMTEEQRTKILLKALTSAHVDAGRPGTGSLADTVYDRVMSLISQAETQKARGGPQRQLHINEQACRYELVLPATSSRIIINNQMLGREQDGNTILHGIPHTVPAGKWSSHHGSLGRVLTGIFNNIGQTPEATAHAMKKAAWETAVQAQASPDLAFGRHDHSIMPVWSSSSYLIGDPRQTELILDLFWKASFLFQRNGHYGLIEAGSPYTSILTANLRTVLTPDITHQGINDLRTIVTMGIPDCIQDPALM